MKNKLSFFAEIKESNPSGI